MRSHWVEESHSEVYSREGIGDDTAVSSYSTDSLKNPW